MSNGPLTRRRFLSTLALAAPALSRVMLALTATRSTQLAFVGVDSLGHDGSGHIDVYRNLAGHWDLSSSIAAAAPRALALHPTLPVLYVAHCVVEHEYRPRGTVSSFHIDTATARLSLSENEPLTLAATLPDHIAIAPDGNHLVVASSSAAIINLFPLRSDGFLLPAPSPLKIPPLRSSHLSIAFEGPTSIRATVGSGGVTNFTVQPDSTLVRNTSDAFLKNNFKRKLAAHSAANLAILNI